MKALIALAALATSATSFAGGWVQYGKLKINQDSISFTGNCSKDDTFVSFNSDGSFDLLFTTLDAESGTDHATRACMVKFDAKTPQGFAITTSKAGIAGTADIGGSNGRTIATLRHTLAGRVGPAAIVENSYIPGQRVQDVVAEKAFAVASYVWNPCGADLTFKATVQIQAKGDDAAINISEGAVKGKQKRVRYYWFWQAC